MEKGDFKTLPFVVVVSFIVGSAFKEVRTNNPLFCVSSALECYGSISSLTIKTI